MPETQQGPEWREGSSMTSGGKETGNSRDCGAVKGDGKGRRGLGLGEEANYLYRVWSRERKMTPS